MVLGIAYQAWLLSIHTVIPHKIYRSAQLPRSVLKHVAQTKHIQTIINLRGPNPDDKWYQEEFQLSEQLGIKHYDITMSSYYLPPKQYLRKLVYLLMTAPKPILVHCLSGSDRSGLAAAIAVILNGNPSLNKSERQFSWRYLVTSDKSIGKQIFSYYLAWLQHNHLTHSKTHFLQWLCIKEPMNQQDPKYRSRFPFLYNEAFLKQICDKLHTI